MGKITNPNAIEILYYGLRYRLGDMSEARQAFTAKTPEGHLEFTGTRTEARDFFRNKFPSKVFIFRQGFK